MLKKISLFLLLSLVVACSNKEKEFLRNGGSGGQKPPPPVEEKDPLEKVKVVPSFVNEFAKKSVALPRIAAKFVSVDCDQICELKAEIFDEYRWRQETYFLTHDLWVFLEKEFNTDDKMAHISYLLADDKKVIVYFDSGKMFFDIYSNAKGYASGLWKVVGEPRQDPVSKEILFEIADDEGKNKKTWRIPEDIANKIVELDNKFAKGESKFVILISDSKVVGLLINGRSTTFLKTE